MNKKLKSKIEEIITRWTLEPDDIDWDELLPRLLSLIEQREVEARIDENEMYISGMRVAHKLGSLIGEIEGLGDMKITKAFENTKIPAKKLMEEFEKRIKQLKKKQK